MQQQEGGVGGAGGGEDRGQSATQPRLFEFARISRDGSPPLPPPPPPPPTPAPKHSLVWNRFRVLLANKKKHNWVKCRKKVAKLRVGIYIKRHAPPVSG